MGTNPTGDDFGNHMPPAVILITPLGKNPSNAQPNLQFTVTFSTPVNNVTAADFSAVQIVNPTYPGIFQILGTVTTVTPNSTTFSTTFTVTVSGVTLQPNTGNGELALELADQGATAAQEIQNATGTVLGGYGSAGASPFIGQPFIIDQTPPTLTPANITFVSSTLPTATTTATATFDLTFSQPVTGLTLGNFTLTASGYTPNPAAQATVLTQTDTAGASYQVTFNTGASFNNSGTFQPVIHSGVESTATYPVISDLAGNPLANPPVSGPAIPFNFDQPAAAITLAQGQTGTTSNPTINFTVNFTDPTTGNPMPVTWLSAAALGQLLGIDTSASTATFVGGTPTIVVTPAAGTPASTFNVAVSNMFTSGTVVIRVDAGVAYSASGIMSTQSALSPTVNYVAQLAATIVKDTTDVSPAQADPVNNDPKWNGTIYFTVTFNQPVSVFTSSMLNLSTSTVPSPGSLTSTVTQITPTVYRVAVSGMTGTGA